MKSTHSVARAPRCLDHTSTSSAFAVNTSRLQHGDGIAKVEYDLRCAAVQRTVFIQNTAAQQRSAEFSCTRVSVRVGTGQRGGFRTRPEDEREDRSPRREPT